MTIYQNLARYSLPIFLLTSGPFTAQAESLADKVNRLEKEIADLRAASSPRTSKKSEAAKPGKAAEKEGKWSEGEAKGANEKLQDDPSRFFFTPDSPAAAVLGIAPEKVIHADTPKQLVTAAINGLDDKGHFQTGVAIDFAPAQLFRDAYKRRKTTGAALKERTEVSWLLTDYWREVANRTQISFAAIRGTEDEDKSSKLALGINIPLIDAEDRLVTGGLKRRGASGNKFAYEAYGDALNPEFVNDTPFDNDNVYGKLMNILHRHASLSVGAAATWVSLDPDKEDYEYSGTTAWGTFTLSFARPGNPALATARTADEDGGPDAKGLYPKAPYRLLLHARYDDHQTIAAGDAVNPPKDTVDPVTGTPIPAAAFVNQDTLLAVAALRLGRKDFNATASLAYVKRWQRSGGSGEEDSLIYSVSAEKRIGTGPMWITLSAGQEVGGTNDGNTILLGGVRLGFGKGSFGNEDAGEL